MSWVRVTFARAAALLRRRRLEEELQTELRNHLEMDIEDRVGRGMRRDEARQAAQRSLGDTLLISQSRWTVRVFAAMFAAFAWIAVVLSAVGLYGVTAYSVTQRRQEVGVRMALGAQRGDIVWLFTRRAFVSLSVGLVAGLAGALAIGPLLRVFLVQTSPGDPVTLAAVAGVLVVVARRRERLARAARDASEPGDCPAHRISSSVTCQRVSLLERACERRVAPPLPAGDPPISKTVR